MTPFCGDHFKPGATQRAEFHRKLPITFEHLLNTDLGLLFLV